MAHMESSINNMPQASVNSIITQKMIDGQVQPDTFEAPLHILSQEIFSHLINYWKHSNPNLCETRTHIAQHT